MLRFFLVLVLVTLAPTAYAADQKQMEENKKVVLQFYEAAINQKDFEAAAKFLGPRYIQHNPRAADGPEGLKAFLAYLREKFPDYHSEIKRAFADGDYVILHVHNVPTPRQPRQCHYRHLPAGERQGGRALGRASGNPRAVRQCQHDVLAWWDRPASWPDVFRPSTSFVPMQHLKRSD